MTFLAALLQDDHEATNIYIIINFFSNIIITLRTLIFARHLFSRMHIFAACIFAPEAPGVNFRYVSIFAWWLFSFFPPENLLEVIFAPVYILINIVINLICL